MKQAETYDEIRPLIAMCKDGRVFDAQAWIAAGKPVDPPHWLPKCSRKRTPLQYAIDSGCHSMVQILLEGGAEVEQNNRYCALLETVRGRRADLLKMLVAHGGDVRKPEIYEVFSSWDAEIIGLFIDHGADVNTDNPMANALYKRNRIALNVLMKYKDKVPDFQRQSNLALSHHCREGNQKWVSLMLWAGADPYDYAEIEPGNTEPLEGPQNAIEKAIAGEHLDVLKMKGMLKNPLNPNASKCLRYACTAKDERYIALMLKTGHQVNDRPDGSSSLIPAIYSHLPRVFCSAYGYPYHRSGRSTYHVDEAAVDRKVKILELILEHGAKWRPVDSDEILGMRKAMAWMDESAILDFVRLMKQHKVCTRSALEELFQKGFTRLRRSYAYDEILKLMARMPAS
jgi:hypothetical protein